MKNEQRIQETREFAKLGEEFNQIVDQLFYNTEKADRLKSYSNQMVSDAVRIVSNRGISTPTVGFFGTKNAGKSFLLRSLIKKDSLKESVKTGYAGEGTTDRLNWFGDKAPTDLDPSAEVFQSINTEQDTLLDRKIILVDIPGFTDPNTKAVAKHALTSCQLKVLVIDAADVEREDASNYGMGFDGAYILPVINRLPGDPDTYDTRPFTESLMSNLSKWVPKAKCLDPVVLPHLRHEDVTWTEEQCAEHLANTLIHALGQLQDLPGEAKAQISLRMERFRGEIRQELPEFSEMVEQVTEDLESAMGGVNKVANELLGSDKVAEMSVRLGVRAQIVDETSPVFFPYRSVQRILTITSGAWDSLTMGLTGSIPSLALTAVKSIKNAKNYSDWSVTMEKGLRKRLEKAADKIAKPVLMKLCREIDRVGSKNSKQSNMTSCNPLIEVTGVEDLMEESRKLFEGSIKQHSPSRLVNTLVALLATVVFAALISGPLMSLYSNYIGVAQDVYNLQDKAFSDFPTIDFGVLFASLTLSILPVFIIAGLYLSFRTSQTKVRQCVSDLHTEHRKMVSESVASGSLQIRTENPKVEAAKWLGRFLSRE